MVSGDDDSLWTDDRRVLHALIHERSPASRVSERARTYRTPSRSNL